MYRFKSSYIENLSAEERQHLLMSAIPMLPDFQTKAGNEGQIFYVSKDVIVKRYFSKIDKPEVLTSLFNKYCEECEEFWQKGYRIPRIYAWTMISKPDHSGFDYYLLEEQVPGRELFFSNIMKMYEQEFKDHLTKEDYTIAVQFPEENPKLYEKISDFHFNIRGFLFRSDAVLIMQRPVEGEFLFVFSFMSSSGTNGLDQRIKQLLIPNIYQLMSSNCKNLLDQIYTRVGEINEHSIE